MARDHLFLGVGGGNFEVFYPRYNRETSADRLFGFERQARFAHNEFVQVLADYGAVGLLFFLAFLFGLAAAAWRLARRGAPGGDRELGLAALAAAVAFLLFSLFSFPLHRATPPLLLALAAGIATRGAGRMEGRGGGRTVPLPRAAGVLAAGAAMTMAVAAVAWTTAELRGDYHLNRALGAYRAEDWRSALREGQLANEACPPRVDGLAVAGAAALELDLPERAAPLLSRVLESRPWHLNSLLNLGVACADLGRPADGARYTERALSLVPGNGLAHANLGYQYMKAEEFEKAREHLRAAIGAGCDDALRRSQLGYALYRLGRYGESAGEFEKALELDPDRADARRYLATIYAGHLDDSERDAARERARKSIEGDDRGAPGGADPAD
jgi:tetratricopeptide (TPR) repeat protein